MRESKGVTLVSLIIYVIGMAVILGIIATLTSFFYKNVDIADINNDTTQYTKFSSIFLEEVNRKSNAVIDCKTLEEDSQKVSYIIFSSGNQYTFKAENKAIYKNKIKICESVEECNFEYVVVDGEYHVKVDFKSKGIDFSGDSALTYIMTST